MLWSLITNTYSLILWSLITNSATVSIVSSTLYMIIHCLYVNYIHTTYVLHTYYIIITIYFVHTIYTYCTTYIHVLHTIHTTYYILYYYIQSRVCSSRVCIVRVCSIYTYYILHTNGSTYQFIEFRRATSSSCIFSVLYYIQ